MNKLPEPNSDSRHRRDPRQTISGVQSTDRRIAGIAERQDGVVGRRQLIQAGISPSLISYRLRVGRLRPVLVGVYTLGAGPLGLRARMTAGLLFGGEGTILSHRTAAFVWGLLERPGHVEVLRRFNRALPGRIREKWLTVHRTRLLPAVEVARCDGFPLTSVSRTLIDLAAFLSMDRLESCLIAAERLRIVDASDLGRALERGPGWKGIGRLRRLVESWNPEVTQTESSLEERFFTFCRSVGLPSPTANAIVEGLRVDCYWPARRHIVELDSRRHHGNALAMERDRFRDLTLQSSGYGVTRVTHQMLEDAPEKVAETLRRILLTS